MILRDKDALLRLVTIERTCGYASYPRALLARAEQRLKGEDPPNTQVEWFREQWSMFMGIWRVIKGNLT